MEDSRLDNVFGVSIIICTYNRPHLVKLNVDKLFSIFRNELPLEVIIIDNSDNENTKMTFQDIITPFSFKYIHEPRKGSSLARNIGAKVVIYKWLCFLDDDLQVHDNFFIILKSIFEDFSEKFFVGGYNPWYINNKPKWIPDDFGRKYFVDYEKSHLLGDNYVSAGVMIIKKEIFFTLGSFPEEMGPKGDKMSYGEEYYLQIKAEQSELPIRAIPQLKADHLVAKFKQNVNWMIKEKFKTSKDATIIELELKEYRFFKRCYENTKLFLISLVKVPAKLFLKKNYFWQNAILDLFTPISRNFGIVFGVFIYYLRMTNLPIPFLK